MVPCLCPLLADNLSSSQVTRCSKLHELDMIFQQTLNQLYGVSEGEERPSIINVSHIKTQSQSLLCSHLFLITSHFLSPVFNLSITTCVSEVAHNDSNALANCWFKCSGKRGKWKRRFASQFLKRKVDLEQKNEAPLGKKHSVTACQCLYDNNLSVGSPWFFF